jgi:hypothetical protein
MTVVGVSKPSAAMLWGEAFRHTAQPTGTTAANVLGLSTQNPARLEYATTASDPPTGLGDPKMAVRRPRSRQRLSDHEGAILEVLRARANTSELGPHATIEKITRLLTKDDTFTKLVEVASEEPPRVRAMLGALGDEIGADPSLLKQLRGSLNKLSRFDFGHLRSLRYARQWQAK